MDNEPAHPLKVFLCHASGDKPPVRDLYKRLTAEGVDAWLDKEKLLPGQDWRLEIPKAVKEADVVIVCLSNKSVTKEGYVQKEIKFALDIAEEKPEGAIFLIPARLEDCLVPERLSRWQWVDLYEEDGFIQLLRSLKLRADVVGATVEPISYEDSNKELEQRIKQLYTEGLAAFYMEDWDRACQRFQTIFSEQPNHRNASEKLEESVKQRTLARLYERAKDAVQSEDWGIAIKTLDELSQISSNYKDVIQLLRNARKQEQLGELYAEAKTLHEAQKWEAVLKVFDQISGIDPNYVDVEGLLPSAQKEVTELKRLSDLNDQYSRAVEEMDAGHWHEARRLLEQIHKSEIGFLETERLLKKVEEEIFKGEEKRKQNDQVNTLYEQAHGLLRSKKWRKALDKIEEIERIDGQFIDSDGIAEQSRKELVREEQEAERQNKLAELYAESVRLLKEEKYQEALEKWQEVKAVDPKYPDRQWVQRTAKKELTEQANPISARGKFFISKWSWIGLGGIGVVVVLFFGIYLFEHSDYDISVATTPMPTNTMVENTALVPKETDIPQKTEVPPPTTFAPTPRGYSDLLYDDFDTATFDGGYNTNLWRVDSWMVDIDSADYLIHQDKGKLAMSMYNDAGLSLTGRYPIFIKDPTYFEGRLFLDPKTTDKDGGLFIQAATNNGYTLCGIFRTGDYAQQIKCWSEYYGTRTETKLGLDGLLPSWHMLRLEINPETMIVDYIVDGQQVASFNPRESMPDRFDDFKSSEFTFVIALDNYGHSKAPVGYVDFARMGKAKEDPLLFFDDFNGPELNESYTEIPEHLVSSGYKGEPSYSFELLEQSTVIRLRNRLRNNESVGWQTVKVFDSQANPIRLEVRFNTLIQSPAKSIDGFLEMGFVDGGNDTYNKAGLFAGNFGKDRTFNGEPVDLVDNTWYRVVLTAAMGQDVKAVLYDDSGGALMQSSLGQNNSLFVSGIKIGLDQSMGAPTTLYPVDVAIDWIRLMIIPSP